MIRLLNTVMYAVCPYTIEKRHVVKNMKDGTRRVCIVATNLAPYYEASELSSASWLRTSKRG